MKILITGVAGFIGAAVAKKLLEHGNEIIGIDDLNDYYDVQLKKDRLESIPASDRFKFLKLDIANQKDINDLFRNSQPQRVIHLAAQAGVRYSLVNPHAYVRSNLDGFINILEGCRIQQVEHLVYASSSSIYGANTQLPFSTQNNANHPVSIYGATKKANELMAHSYSHLYNLPTTGLRFFTVYGPWGRPDMSLFLFTKKILAGEPIDIFNNGDHSRDFTYIDDIVDGVARVTKFIAKPDDNWNSMAPNPGTSQAPYRIYNIGNHKPVELMRFIEVLEKCLGKNAIKNYLGMQPGDVKATYADIDDLVKDVEFVPETPIEVGVAKFVKWYLNYYKA